MNYRQKIRLALELRRKRRKYKDEDEDDITEHAEKMDGDLEPGSIGDGRIRYKHIEDENDNDY